MIYDRTIDDVNNAKSIIEEKVKTFLELTDDETEILERGCFTLNTLNRIENKINDLYTVLLEYGYDTKCDVVSEDYWENTHIVTDGTYTRILNNITKLKKGFAYLNNGTLTPLSMTNYQQLNDVEKILVDIEDLLNNMVSEWKYANNEYYCGGVI